MIKIGAGGADGRGRAGQKYKGHVTKDLVTCAGECGSRTKALAAGLMGLYWEGCSQPQAQSGQGAVEAARSI